MRDLIAGPALLIVALLSLSGCVLTPPVNTVTSSREIVDIDAVALRTSGEVTIAVGSTPSLSLDHGGY